MHGAFVIVDEDRPGDAQLVPQPPRGSELRLEVGMRGQVLPRVGLARIEEVPAVAGIFT